MCGRFVIELSPELVARFFGLAETPDLPPRYNVAPTQPVPAIREASDGSRRLSMMRWGLVPSWAKDIGDGLINARCETVNEKPSFRQTFRRRRCIIPASGFYEWLRHVSCMYDCPARPSDRTCRPIGSTLRGRAARQRAV